MFRMVSHRWVLTIVPVGKQITDDCLNNFKGIPVKACNHEVFMMFNARRLKMNRSAFSAVVLAATVGGSLYDATAQTINPPVQTTAPGVVASRSAPVAAGKPVANGRVVPRVVTRPTALNPQRFNQSVPRAIAQPPANLQRPYSPIVQRPNFGVATLNAPAAGPVQQPMTLDPATRQTELRTLAATRQRRGV